MTATLSLRSKLLLLMLAIQLGMLALLLGNGVLQMQSSLKEQAELRMRQVAASLHPALITALANDDLASLQGLVDASRAAGELERLLVFSSSGELLVASMAASGGREERLLSERMPLELEGLLYGYLEIGISDQFLRDAQAALLSRSLLLAGSAIVLATVMLSLAVRWMMRHLDALRAASAAWARGEFGKRAPVRTQDEIGCLAAEFNRMAEVLQERMETLRQAQEEFRAIADHTFSWVSWLGPDGRARWINPSIERISGYTVAEGMALKDFLGDLLHPDDAPLLAQIREKMRRGEAGDCGKLRLITKQGEVRWIRLSWQPIRSSDGQEMGISTSIVDITTRVQVEQALRQSEARFAAAAQVAKLGHWSWRPSDSKLRWSDEVYRIFGLEPQSRSITFEEFLQRLVPPDRERVAAALQQAWRHKVPYQQEFRVLRDSGEVRHVHAQARIEHDSQGEPERMFGTLQDITERKEAQLALARLNRIYAVLSETNKAVVRERDQIVLFRRICQIMAEVGELQLAWFGAVDSETGNVVPIAYGGPASGYVYGLRISLANPQQAQGPIATAVRTGRLQVQQDIVAVPAMEAWKERAKRWNLRSMTVAPLILRGQVAAVLAVYSDEPGYFSADIVELMEALAADISFALHAFTEESRRRRAESKLVRLNAELEARIAERTAALEAANEELEAFSYSVSHDLRAPLRSIDGFSRQLLKHHAHQLDAVGLNYLERIVRASGRMEQLIADLLRLSKIGRQALQPRKVNLSSLAQAVIDDLRQAAPERQVQVSIEPELTVWADPQLLRIALENLLGNAWKFTSDKPDAQIRLGAIRRQDQQPILYVRDNGAGFDNRFVHRLFAPFQRLHAPNQFEGTGIGLATVQRIIHKHGGRIWAEGKVGAGAVFYFTLKEPPSQEQEDATALEPIAWSQGRDKARPSGGAP
ncbi:MAG: PAS domain-containing protein [Xanthomonadaceae bacterium]|nr:PAS domain-containing protein [Xanthomonadaceae bacterium]